MIYLLFFLLFSAWHLGLSEKHRAPLRHCLGQLFPTGLFELNLFKIITKTSALRNDIQKQTVFILSQGSVTQLLFKLLNLLIW